MASAVASARGVSLMAGSGLILGLIGPSGSGRTTTIRLILGALAPDSGRVSVLSEDPRFFRRRTRERIGYMPQLFVLSSELTETARDGPRVELSMATLEAVRLSVYAVAAWMALFAVGCVAAGLYLIGQTRRAAIV